VRAEPGVYKQNAPVQVCVTKFIMVAFGGILKKGHGYSILLLTKCVVVKTNIYIYIYIYIYV
jgi:hypothetical protein